MRLFIAAASLAVLLALPSLAATGAQGRTGRRPTLSTAEVKCPASAVEPSGLCSPYDREHCRFEDGTLQRDDASDPRAPFFLKPVQGKQGVYCRYDGSLHFAGVAQVDDPATQKRRWDATKARRRHQ
jgi:hypothetical protein